MDACQAPEGGSEEGEGRWEDVDSVSLHSPPSPFSPTDRNPAMRKTLLPILAAASVPLLGACQSEPPPPPQNTTAAKTTQPVDSGSFRTLHGGQVVDPQAYDSAFLAQLDDLVLGVFPETLAGMPLFVLRGGVMLHPSEGGARTDTFALTSLSPLPGKTAIFRRDTAGTRWTLTLVRRGWTALDWTLVRDSTGGGSQSRQGQMVLGAGFFMDPDVVESERTGNGIMLGDPWQDRAADSCGVGLGLGREEDSSSTEFVQLHSACPLFPGVGPAPFLHRVP